MNDRIEPQRSVRLGLSGDRWRRPLGATLSPFRRRVRSALLALVGFVIGCALFDRLLMPRMVRLGDEVEVPEVTGLSLDEAKKKLDASDLKADAAPGRYSSEIPRGQVLLSLPQAGSRVKRHRQIELTQSLGAVDRRIPNLLSATVRMARIQLQEMGVRSGSIVYAATDEMSPDQVMAMSPDAGSEVAGDEAVSFLVSKPEKKRPFVLPNLRGLKEDEATTWLRANGFNVSFSEESGAGQGWYVVATDPPTGGMIWTGSTVRLTTDTAELFPENGGDFPPNATPSPRNDQPRQP